LREIDAVYIHAAYTPADMDVGVEEIRKWHVDPPPRGRGWSDIGYHYVIRRDGTLETGRPVEIAGAHAYGHNTNSIGVCLVGGKKDNHAQFNFTKGQMDTLRLLVEELVRDYQLQLTDVHGHNEVSSKECPCFDVQQYFNGGE